MENLRDYKITFGRHKGSTVEQVVMTDPTYMKFLEKNQYKVDDENKTLVFAYRPGDYVMPFGKHTGKTVSEIIKVDPDYHQKLALVRDQKTGAQAYTDIVRKFSDFKLLQQ